MGHGLPSPIHCHGAAPEKLIRDLFDWPLGQARTWAGDNSKNILII